MSTPAADALQKVFKTLADPTRVRILRLLEQEELIVGELMAVLGMAQSRVSRHLAILREAGLLTDRRDGTFVAYRLALPEEGPWHDAWELARNSLMHDPTAERDDALLRRTIAGRRSTSGRDFFDEVGPEWDALRRVFGDLVAVLSGREPQQTRPSLGLVADTMLDHVERLVEFHDRDENGVVRQFRKHAGWYVAGFPVGREVRRQLHAISSLADLKAITDGFDRDVILPPEGVRVKRSHTGGPRRVILPEGWLDDPDEYVQLGAAAEANVSGG